MHTHRRGHTVRHTLHAHDTYKAESHIGLLRVWYCEGREVCWPEKMAALVCDNCCWVAAACAYRTYLFHQWHASRIWFIQYMYLTGIIRSKKDLRPDIERLHAGKYAFANFDTANGIWLSGWWITVCVPSHVLFNVQMPT